MPMFAPYLKNLRVKLQERKDAVLRAKFDYLESHLKTFLNFVSSQPLLSTITLELERSLPTEEKDKLIKKLDTSDIFGLSLSEDERIRSSHLLVIANYMIDPKYSGDFFQKLTSLFRYGETDKCADEYTEQLFLPLYHYYDEKIDDSDLLLYFLLKYKRLCEWFDRESLFRLAQQDSSKREAVLDLHLRRFLMQEGFDYPFSTPHSPKGRADIVVHLEEKPLPLEIKIFDGESYGKSYLRKGFNQALKYAEDYHQATGYLVVFNLSDELLQFGKNATDDYFPKVEAQNKTIFIVTVNIRPITSTASQEKEAKIVVVEEEYLVSSNVES